MIGSTAPLSAGSRSGLLRRPTIGVCTQILGPVLIPTALGTLQFAHNAVKFPTSGQIIALGSPAETDRVHPWGRDTGPGVPAAATTIPIAQEVP